MGLIERAKEALNGATPGPWPLEEDDYALGYDCMTGGVRVGNVVLDGRDYGQKPCKPISKKDLARLMSDARLIALSPDLARLAVAAGELADMVQCWDECGCTESALREALARFRAIAEGKE
jgi:hypothetical protein